MKRLSKINSNVFSVSMIKHFIFIPLFLMFAAPAGFGYDRHPKDPVNCNSAEKFLFQSQGWLGKSAHADFASLFKDYDKAKRYDAKLKSLEAGLLDMRAGITDENELAKLNGYMKTELAAIKREAERDILDDIEQAVQYVAKKDGYKEIVRKDCGAPGKDMTYAIMSKMNAGWLKVIDIPGAKEAASAVLSKPISRPPVPSPPASPSVPEQVPSPRVEAPVFNLSKDLGLSDKGPVAD